MASNFFNQNNPYNVAMSTIGDLAMLSIAWFVGSIPIVTIGVSTSAACEVARTMQEARDHGIFRGYIAAYKRRIGTNLILSLIIAAVWALAAFDLRFLSMQQGGDAISVVYGITVAIFAILGVMLAFVLPLSGRSKLGVAEQIKQSFKLAVLKPLVAIAVFILDILPIALFTIPGAIIWVPMLWILVASGGSFWLQILMIRKAFKLE